MVFVPNILDTPAGALILADKLVGAIAIIESWGIRVSPKGRLQSAVRLLRRVAREDTYPRAHEDLIKLGNAIRIAFDFYHVTAFLGQERVDAIAEDLRRALQGTLGDYWPTQAHRAQSQLVMAAVAAAGGLKPGAPALGTKRTPDYVLRIGSLPFGFEIKRPESEDSAASNLAEAVGQLHAYGSRYSAVVLDVSDSLTAHAFGPSREAVAATVRERFRPLYTMLSNDLESKRHEEAYSRIALLFVFCNTFAWVGDPPRPGPLFMYYGEVVRTACSGLVVEQAHTLRDGLMRGFERLGGEHEAVRRV